MQLGNCWFDTAKGELVNQGNGDSWHLPRAELQVLSLLIEYRGKLVAKPLLKAGDGQHPSLSDSSVTRAVFMLRSFLGPQDETLIETVKGEGYLLRHKQYRQQFSKLSVPFTRISVLSIAIILCVALSGITLMHMSLADNNVVSPLKASSVKLASGQDLQLILYANSKTNNELLLSLSDEVQLALSSCDNNPWQKVYLALSHDKQVLNLTLRGEHFGQSIVRNLKISDLRQPKEFVTATWLREVGVCD